MSNWKKATKDELKTKYDNRGKYGGDSDRKSYIDTSVPMFVPEEGENCVRILPLHPNEMDTKHYGLDVHFHRNVGVNEDYYLCLKRMKKSNCPICDHQKSLWNDDPEMAKELYPDQRCLVWVVDRKDDEVKLWSAPKTAMDDILGISYKKKTGEIIDISDPDEGYNLFFDRIGLGRNTKYKNYQLDDETNVVDVGLIEKISPFRDVLIWATYEEVKAAFTGMVIDETVVDETVVDETPEESETVRDLTNDDIDSNKKNQDVVDTSTVTHNCFGSFNAESDECEDCNVRKNCRVKTKRTKVDVSTTQTKTTPPTDSVTSVKNKLDEALRKRREKLNGKT